MSTGLDRVVGERCRHRESAELESSRVSSSKSRGTEVVAPTLIYARIVTGVSSDSLARGVPVGPMWIHLPRTIEEEGSAATGVVAAGLATEVGGGATRPPSKPASGRAAVATTRRERSVVWRTAVESRMFAEVVAGGGVGRVGALGSRMDVEEVVRKRAREARLQHSSHPLQLPRASGDGHNEAALVSSSNLHSKKRARTLEIGRAHV